MSTGRLFVRLLLIHSIELCEWESSKSRRRRGAAAYCNVENTGAFTMRDVNLLWWFSCLSGSNRCSTLMLYILFRCLQLQRRVSAFVPVCVCVYGSVCGSLWQPTTVQSCILPQRRQVGSKYTVCTVREQRDSRPESDSVSSLELSLSHLKCYEDETSGMYFFFHSFIHLYALKDWPKLTEQHNILIFLSDLFLCACIVISWYWDLKLYFISIWKRSGSEKVPFAVSLPLSFF